MTKTLLFLGVLILSSLPCAAKNLALTGGTLITVSGGVLENADVLIEGGKITAIGKNIPLPAGIETIDVSGKYLMPGIIDTHTHIAVEMSDINEESSPIRSQVWLRDALIPDHYSIPLLLAGGVTTVKTMNGSGNVIGGVNATIKLKYNTSVEEMIIDDARQQIKMALGENPKRDHKNTRSGNANVMRNAFIEARAYKKKWDQYEQGVKAGKKGLKKPEKNPQMETLKLVLEKKISIDSHTYRAEEMVWMINFVKENDLVLKQFSHATDAYKVADVLAEADVSYGGWVDRWGFKEEAYDNNPWGFEVMRDAGTNIVLNTDTISVPNVGRYLYSNSAKVLKYNDLSDLDVLKMITLNAAKALDIEHRTGSLEVGKDGDIAIFDKHPLDSTGKCILTVIEGKVYFDYSKDSITAQNNSQREHSS